MTYDEAIGGDSRRTSAQVTFELLDVTASQDVTISVTDKDTIVSRENEINNARDFNTLKYTSLERNYIKLDGTHHVMPKTTDVIPYQVGYISSTFSDSNGDFANPPKLIFNFTTTHSSIGLTLDFDEEYPTSLTFIYYDSSNNIIKNDTISNNETHLVYGAKVNNYQKIEVLINSTLHPFRKARVYATIFGIIQIFKDNDLIEMNVTRETSLVDTTIPISTMDFKINNIDRRFNLINPSGIYSFLQQKQLIKSKIGVYTDDGIIWENTGNYYLNNWKTDGITATLSASDKLSFIDTGYEVSTNTTKTLKQWAIEILSSVGITDYEIDDSLASISCTTRFDRTPVRDLLKYIAIASRTIFYLDRNDKVILKPIPSTAVGEITFDNMYKEPTISLVEATSDVDVYVWVYGTPIEQQTKIRVTDSDVDGENIFEVKENPFITTSTIATNVANWVKGILHNRLQYEIDWRQNPRIEIGNLIQVEDGFNENRNMLVEKNILKYQGYLSGATDGKGA